MENTDYKLVVHHNFIEIKLKEIAKELSDIYNNIEELDNMAKELDNKTFNDSVQKIMGTNEILKEKIADTESIMQRLITQESIMQELITTCSTQGVIIIQKNDFYVFIFLIVVYVLF